MIAPDLPDSSAAAQAPTAGRQWLERLIGFDTTSRASNLGLIETVRDDLRRQGIDAVLSYDAGGTKANLFATLPAADGGTQGGIVLSGHTDVVPVDGQAWDTDPFRATERDGRIYGRGACDMKGFLAVALALTPTFLATRRRLPLHLALSFDEELGCVGAPYMIEDLQRRGIRPDSCIVGEPSDMRVIVAHKGINAWRCRVHGHAAHSSLTPKGVNAIEYAAKLIGHLRTLADRFAAQGPYDDAFDVPFSTLSTGTIKGGIATNTIPEQCEFTFEYRNLPGVDAAAIIEEIRRYASDTLEPPMRAVHPGAGIAFEPLAVSPELDVSEQAAITQLVRALLHDNERRKVAYGTEAGLFARAGIPSVICGPGSIEQAHKPNEYVALEQLALCERFLLRINDSLAA